MALYDPFFRSEPQPLRRRYDFSTCTGTAEHFHHPAGESDRLDTLLRPGDWLGLVFYREATLHTIAAQRNWACESPARDVALLRKPAGAP